MHKEQTSWCTEKQVNMQDSVTCRITDMCAMLQNIKTDQNYITSAWAMAQLNI